MYLNNAWLEDNSGLSLLHYITVANSVGHLPKMHPHFSALAEVALDSSSSGVYLD